MFEKHAALEVDSIHHTNVDITKITRRNRVHKEYVHVGDLIHIKPHKIAYVNESEYFSECACGANVYCIMHNLALIPI